MAQTSSSFRRDARDLDGSISLSEIISALSYALDLTEGAVHGHALRSCLLGMRIAAEAKLIPEQTGSLYFALLLKDIGCSSDASRISPPGQETAVERSESKLERLKRSHKTRIAGFKLPWRNGVPELRPAARLADDLGIGFNPGTIDREKISLRSDRGARIVRKLGVGEAAAEAVRSLDERWDGGGFPDSLTGEQIPLLSRICAVAQYLDVCSVLYGTHRALETLESCSGTWFDPELVRIAVSLHRNSALWTQCRPDDAEEDTRQAVLDLDNGRRHRLESSRIDQICEAFADVVDAKSHFTFRHSLGVADAALGIAQDLGIPADRTQLVRRAALLHDIGKLSVSNRILDKKTGLEPEEWSAVYRHPSITPPDSGESGALSGDRSHCGRAPRETRRVGLSAPVGGQGPLAGVEDHLGCGCVWGAFRGSAVSSRADAGRDCFNYGQADSASTRCRLLRRFSFGGFKQARYQLCLRAALARVSARVCNLKRHGVGECQTCGIRSLTYFLVVIPAGDLLLFPLGAVALDRATADGHLN